MTVNLSHEYLTDYITKGNDVDALIVPFYLSLIFLFNYNQKFNFS